MKKADAAAVAKSKVRRQIKRQVHDAGAALARTRTSLQRAGNDRAREVPREALR